MSSTTDVNELIFQIPGVAWLFIYLRSCPAEHYGELEIVLRQALLRLQVITPCNGTAARNTGSGRIGKLTTKFSIVFSNTRHSLGFHLPP